jgi:NAD-dependent SIR2 family protein deacetylase
MAFVSLIDAGLLKFVISQNVDGLHRKSGITPDMIAELHGNTNIDLCT